MTHAPPVPAGNQSPYPIAEPPHAKSATPAPDAASDKDEGAVTAIVARLPSVEPRTAYIGAVAVVAAGAVAGLFYALTGRKAKAPPRSAPKSPPKPRRAKTATGGRRKASAAK